MLDLLSNLKPDLIQDLIHDLMLDLIRDLILGLTPDLLPDLIHDLNRDLTPDLILDLIHDLIPYLLLGRVLFHYVTTEGNGHACWVALGYRSLMASASKRAGRTTPRLASPITEVVRCQGCSAKPKT